MAPFLNGLDRCVVSIPHTEGYSSCWPYGCLCPGSTPGFDTRCLLHPNGFDTPVSCLRPSMDSTPDRCVVFYSAHQGLLALLPLRLCPGSTPGFDTRCVFSTPMASTHQLYPPLNGLDRDAPFLFRTPKGLLVLLPLRLTPVALLDSTRAVFSTPMASTHQLVVSAPQWTRQMRRFLFRTPRATRPAAPTAYLPR
jgi:hypothetical protein